MLTREVVDTIRAGYQAPASESHLRGTIGLLLDHADEQDKVIEQLREALEPFGKFCKAFDCGVGGLAKEDSHTIYAVEFRNGPASITLGMLRKAQAALAAGRGK
jgi:hypothetical protein